MTRNRARKAAIAAVLLAAPVAVVTIAALPSEAAVAPAGGGTYTIAATNSGRCIDITGGSTANGGLLQQWGCHAEQTNQQFRVQAQANSQFNLVNVNSTRCVDVPNGAATAGIQIHQWGCGDGLKPAQLFTFTASGTGTYQIRNVASGMCLAVAGSSTANGAAVSQETCAANAGQQWAFNQIGGAPGTWPSTPDGFASTGGGTTGGTGGTTVTVTNQADLATYARASGAYVIRVAATINISPKGTEIPVTSNKTIVGVGTSGQIVGGGFNLGVGTRNVIIRNLTIRDTLMADDDPGDDAYDYDGIQMDTADHIWIDHNLITRMNDGLIDSRKDTTYLTVSWNVLANNNKSFGIGWTTNVTARMTIHHNWIHDTNQRNPSTDNVALAHLYNNYLQNVSGYGNYSRGATKMVLENSYFQSVKDPFYPDATAQLRQSGSVMVSCTGNQTTSGSAFTPSSYYSYTLDAASSLPALLRTSAGPQASITG